MARKWPNQREPTIKWLKVAKMLWNFRWNQPSKRVMLKLRCDKYGYYPLISQHIIDIHQFLTMGIHINPYSASENHEKSKKQPFSAKMAPKWPFLQKWDNDKSQNLVKIGQHVKISMQDNDFMPLIFFTCSKSSENGEKKADF